LATPNVRALLLLLRSLFVGGVSGRWNDNTIAMDRVLFLVWQRNDVRRRGLCATGRVDSE